MRNPRSELSLFCCSQPQIGEVPRRSVSLNETLERGLQTRIGYTLRMSLGTHFSARLTRC